MDPNVVAGIDDGGYEGRPVIVVISYYATANAHPAELVMMLLMRTMLIALSHGAASPPEVTHAR